MVLWSQFQNNLMNILLIGKKLWIFTKDIWRVTWECRKYEHCCKSISGIQSIGNVCLFARVVSKRKVIAIERLRVWRAPSVKKLYIVKLSDKSWDTSIATCFVLRYFYNLLFFMSYSEFLNSIENLSQESEGC